MTIGLWSLSKGLFNTDQRRSGSSTEDAIERSMAVSDLWDLRVAFPSFNIFKLLFQMKLAIWRPLASVSALPQSRFYALKSPIRSIGGGSCLTSSFKSSRLKAWDLELYIQKIGIFRYKYISMAMACNCMVNLISPSTGTDSCINRATPPCALLLQVPCFFSIV